MDFTIEKIPVWAMCYLVNGDYSASQTKTRLSLMNGGNATMSFPYLRRQTKKTTVIPILAIIRLLGLARTLSTAP